MHDKNLPLMLWLAAFVMPLLASAADNVVKNPLGEGATFSNLITRVADFALTIIGPLAAIMVLIAGAIYMTGGGNPEKIKTAHKILLWAVIGIAIVLLAKSVELIVRQILKI